MITTTVEYEKAQSELQDLQERLAELQRGHSIGDKGFTKAGIRKLIARLNEELAVFEGSEEAPFLVVNLTSPRRNSLITIDLILIAAGRHPT